MVMKLLIEVALLMSNKVNFSKRVIEKRGSGRQHQKKRNGVALIALQKPDNATLKRRAEELQEVVPGAGIEPALL
jgi:hypothetical protein